MHIPDGILTINACIALYMAAFGFLAVAWFKIKKNHPRYIITLIAIVSSLLIVIQLFEFPVAGGGSTWHFLGGAAASMVLGPFAAMISMTITLIIQALAFGDGGLTSFGANIVNMAAIGALSFFIVKGCLFRGFNAKKLALGVFLAAFISNVCTALAVGIELGVFPMVGTLGGPKVTVTSMLFWYVPTGIIEGTVSAALIVSLAKLKGVRLFGLELCDAKRDAKK